MQAVVLVVVSALAGGIATVIPALFVSGRRRRAEAVREASALLAELDDGPAKDSVRAALDRNANDYLAWVSESPVERAKRQRNAALWLAFFLTGPLVVTILRNPEAQEGTAGVVLLSLVLMSCAPFLFFLLKFVVLSETDLRDGPREWRWKPWLDRRRRERAARRSVRRNDQES